MQTYRDICNLAADMESKAIAHHECAMDKGSTRESVKAALNAYRDVCVKFQRALMDVCQRAQLALPAHERAVTPEKNRKIVDRIMGDYESVAASPPGWGTDGTL